MKFGNEFWLILFREYIIRKLFAVWGDLRGSMQGYGVRVGEGILVVGQAFAEQLEKIFSRVSPSQPPGLCRLEPPQLDQPQDLKSEVKSNILAFTIFLYKVWLQICRLPKLDVIWVIWIRTLYPMSPREMC
jgi:hypothetical protein